MDMGDRQGTIDILTLLEDGEIDADEAIRQITEQNLPQVEDVEQPSEVFSPPQKWRAWWVIPSSIGFGIMVAGLGVASLGGWWWLLAVPLLFFGIIVMLVGLFSIWAPWVHIRVDTGQESWPKRITISLPLPLGLVSWCLQGFGRFVPGGRGMKDMDLARMGRMLDEMKGSISSENPLFVEIHDEDTGEHVTVYIG
jgi:hypothetical protein